MKILKNKESTKLFILTFLAALSISAILISTEIYFFSGQAKKVALNNAVNKAKEREDVFKSFFNDAEITSNYLSNNKTVITYLESNNKENVCEIFRSIITTKNNITRIRYADQTGHIKLDISKSKKSVNCLENSPVSNITQRYYFRQAKISSSAKPFFSKMDINQNYQKNNKPMEHTVRSIIPVYKKNKFEGAIIINYNLEDFMKKLFYTPLYDMILIDEDGYPYYHYEHNKSLSRFKTPSQKLNGLFEEELPNILKNPVYKTEDIVTKKLDMPTQNRFILFLKLNDKYLINQKQLEIEKYVFIALVSTGIILLLSIIYFHIIRNLLNKIIEKDKVILLHSKKAAMGDLLGIISHQLKQPLNTIKLSKELLKLEYNSNNINDETINNFEEVVDSQVEFMSGSIDEFRNFFRPDKKPGKFLLNKAIEKGLKIIGVQLVKNKITLETDYDDSIEILGYDTEIQQVIINLVNNAKDTLIEAKPDNPFIKIRLFRKQNLAIITVEDNGGGIPEDIIDKVFDSYFTTKGDQGTGIGLNLSKMIVVDSFGGAIEAKNTSAGAKFIIKLNL